MIYNELYTIEVKTSFFIVISILLVISFIVIKIQDKKQHKQKVKRHIQDNNKYIIAKSIVGSLKQEFIGQKVAYFNELMKMM